MTSAYFGAPLCWTPEIIILIVGWSWEIASLLILYTFKAITSSYLHLSQPMSYMLYRTEWHVRGRGKQAAILKTVGYHSSCLLKIPSNENFKTKYSSYLRKNSKKNMLGYFKTWTSLVRLIVPNTQIIWWQNIGTYCHY
jgi:hypothetical protein